MNKILCTHNGQGHLDDYFAVAIFLLANPEYKLIRTRDKKILSEADALIDVGGEHNAEKNRFDHHQIGGAGKRISGIPYASAGLVWKKYGGVVCGNDQSIADTIEAKLISFIDSLDTYTAIYEMKIKDARVYSLREYFYCLFQPFESERGNLLAHDLLFLEAVEAAKKLLLLEIAKQKENKELSELVKDCYEKARDKRIIIIPKSSPFQSVLPKFPEPIFVILPYEEVKFVVIAVKERDSALDRLPFPIEWRGKSGLELCEVTGVPDVEFCHGGGFMVSTHTIESAKAVALKAIELKAN